MPSEVYSSSSDKPQKPEPAPRWAVLLGGATMGILMIFVLGIVAVAGVGLYKLIEWMIAL